MRPLCDGPGRLPTEHALGVVGSLHLAILQYPSMGGMHIMLIPKGPWAVTKRSLAAISLMAIAFGSAGLTQGRSLPVSVDTVASGLVHPCAVAFLPDGRFLVTERPGRTRCGPLGRRRPRAVGAACIGRRGRVACLSARSNSAPCTGWRSPVAGGKVRHKEKLLQGSDERIRDGRQGPDGLLHMVTESPVGRLLRLQPN